MAAKSIAGPMLLAAGGVVLVLAMMGGIVALKPLDFSPPKAVTCEGEACAHGSEGTEAKPGEAPATSHAAPAGEHEGAPAGETSPPAEHHE